MSNMIKREKNSDLAIDNVHAISEQNRTEQNSWNA